MKKKKNWNVERKNPKEKGYKKFICQRNRKLLEKKTVNIRKKKTNKSQCCSFAWRRGSERGGKKSQPYILLNSVVGLTAMIAAGQQQ